MILPIYIYGQPVLRKVTEDISPDYPNLQELIANMFETMYHADGIGLAAPQIGLPIRLLVIDLDPLSKDELAFAGFKKVMINARILEVEGEEELVEEGCLSLPGINERVPRKDRITIQYQDEQFVSHTESFSGFFARVIQHEFDHLEGVMFIDHISGMRKQMIKSKLNNLVKGKVRCHYRVKTIGKV